MVACRGLIFSFSSAQIESARSMYSGMLRDGPAPDPIADSPGEPPQAANAIALTTIPRTIRTGRGMKNYPYRQNILLALVTVSATRHGGKGVARQHPETATKGAAEKKVKSAA
jgi:hypothetical protein